MPRPLPPPPSIPTTGPPGRPGGGCIAGVLAIVIGGAIGAGASMGGTGGTVGTVGTGVLAVTGSDTSGVRAGSFNSVVVLSPGAADVVLPVVETASCLFASSTS